MAGRPAAHAHYCCEREELLKEIIIETKLSREGNSPSHPSPADMTLTGRCLEIGAEKTLYSHGH